METGSKTKLKLQRKGRWSQLPTHILRMIKDRLNLVGNVLLAAACKDWNSASKSYPPKPQPIAPFLMYRVKDSNNACISADVATMKDNLIFLIPEYHTGTLLLFSRRGWLLFQSPSHSSIVLFHLQTNVTIMMLTLEEGTTVSCASFFSNADGTPYCVALANCVKEKLTLYVANVGDEKWMKYSQGIDRGISSLIVAGSKIHCLDGFGGLYTFDKSNLTTWRTIKGFSKEENTHCYMMESEQGEIMKVKEQTDSRITYKFFKLNERQTGWDELNDKETVGRSWFLSSNCHFTITQNARVKNVYILGTLSLLRRDSQTITEACITFSDLINRSTRRYFLEEQRRWVDLGEIDQLPHAHVTVHAGLNEAG